MLSVIEFIKKNGLSKTILDFNLVCKVYDNKILLKYHQIDSNMSLREVQECRGLILEKYTWKVMSMSFYKFFNYGESNAAIIDWNNARVLEKVDGTMIQLYYDWNKSEWFAGTTGTAEGEGEVNNKFGTSFNQLFWDTMSKKYGVNKNDFDFFIGYTFVFELTTPYNIVVKPHTESSVTLLTIRDNKTLMEVTHDKICNIANQFKIPVVKCYDLTIKNFDFLINTFEKMPWSEEGYVVVDNNFNRVKVKNPTYVAVSHLKSKTSLYNILSIVKTNEIEEFCSVFSERRDELFKLKVSYDNLILKLNSVWSILDNLKPIDSSKEERKRFALDVFRICEEFNVENFGGLFFSLESGKCESVKDFIFKYDNKKLYFILN